MTSEKSVPAVELRGVLKKFNGFTAVERVDLTVSDGHLVTLLGPSGCGKTTILRMIAGLETPTEGDILIKGKRVNDTPIHKRNLGMIFQNYALFPHKNIFDNVAFGLKYRRASREEMKEKVTRALEMVRLPGVEKRMPAQLSGGQQQRIALARAIVIEPDVLLMDEPLSALDENLREEMRREIDRLQMKLGLTTIFVTHDQREALSMSNEIVVMKAGRMQQVGTPEEVYNKPANKFVADFLGHSNFLDAVVAGKKDDFIEVEADRGRRIKVSQPGEWPAGLPVELVIRAQKFRIFPRAETPTVGDENLFFGRIKERSYMGGEASYFVELEGSGTELHVISMMRAKPFQVGDELALTVAPEFCRLLPREA
ncbi:MAG: ABC transporter ATP-binding protein [Pseudomonadota bacterium]